MTEPVKATLEEFRAFILKGNIIGLATAVVFGVAFNAVITSFITNIITPLLGIPGHVDVSSLALTINGSNITYGSFINAIINFIVIALVLFFLLIKPMAKLEAITKKEKPVTTKQCPYCFTDISINATRCPNCTSKLGRKK